MNYLTQLEEKYIGFHGSVSLFPGGPLHYACIQTRNPSWLPFPSLPPPWDLPGGWPAATAQNSSVLDGNVITGLYSHELLEACTNPEANGIYDDINSDCPGVTTTGSCELSDLCQTQLINTSASGPFDGSCIVEGYWLQSRNACFSGPVSTGPFTAGANVSPGQFQNNRFPPNPDTFWILESGLNFGLSGVVRPPYIKRPNAKKIESPSSYSSSSYTSSSS